MKQLISLISLFFISSCFALIFGQKKIVLNQKWELTTGSPSPEFDFGNSTTDEFGNLFLTGNEILNNGQIALSIEKISPNGNQLWTQQWLCTACVAATGIDLFVKENALFVVGAVQNNSIFAMDILV